MLTYAADYDRFLICYNAPSMIPFPAQAADYDRFLICYNHRALPGLLMRAADYDRFLICYNLTKPFLLQYLLRITTAS